MLNLDLSNKVSYTINDPSMRRFFAVDASGVFRISANRLTEADSPWLNGTFIVPVLITDLNSCSADVLVTVQLSRFITSGQCPKISDQALCQFTINQSNFDPSKKTQSIIFNLYKLGF